MAKKTKKKTSGKDSGWVGPIEPFTRNKGNVGRKRIVFIGASHKFVHKVLRDMMLVGGFNDCHLVVHDIHAESMNVVADLLDRMARAKKTHITVSRTLDRREALKGADVVILSITTGGMEADFRSFEACAKYGIPVGIGDTLGPAALARNLREIPVVLEIIRDVEEIAPKALMLNFTNPMSCITGAMARNSSVPCWGLCHSADELYRYFASVFNVKKREVDMEVGGVNHQSFVTKLLVRGKDRTKDILSATLASNAKLEDTLMKTRQEEVALQQDIYRVLGAWPSTGEAHLAEFYRYFFTPRRMDRFSHELQHIMPGRSEIQREPVEEIVLDWAYGPEGPGDLHLLTTEHAHELMWSYFTGEPYTRVLNLLNTDEYIKGLPRNACIEAKVTVAGKKIKGRQITLPPAVHALVTNWTAIHDLSIKAAIDCDRDAARQALFLDPHVGDLYDIAPLLEDILKATKPWLSEKWLA